MARLIPSGDTTDFISVRVPKEFVAKTLDAAGETGRITDDDTAEGYRLRVL